MNTDKLNWWFTVTANIGVLAGLVFVGLEIQQNTSQLRTDASYSITVSVNQQNEGIYLSPALAELLLRGEQDLDALNPVERKQFNAYQFSRLNLAEYIEDLDSEGVSDLNFRFSEFLVRQYHVKPGLQAFIREHQDIYFGSDEFLARLITSDSVTEDD
jgi:hypothetical protein